MTWLPTSTGCAEFRGGCSVSLRNLQHLADLGCAGQAATGLLDECDGASDPFGISDLGAEWCILKAHPNMAAARDDVGDERANVDAEARCHPRGARRFPVQQSEIA